MQEIHSNEAILDKAAELQNIQIYHPVVQILNNVRDLMMIISNCNYV